MAHIYSNILHAHIAYNEDYREGKHLPHYYPSEVPHLQLCTVKELQLVHIIKELFVGEEGEPSLVVGSLEKNVPLGSLQKPPIPPSKEFKDFPKPKKTKIIKIKDFATGEYKDVTIAKK